MLSDINLAEDYLEEKTLFSFIRIICLKLKNFMKNMALLGALLMLLYYAVLPFPKPNVHSYIVDEHLIYIFALLVLAAANAGRIWGLDAKRQNS